jgi:hypothetical protein
MGYRKLMAAACGAALMAAILATNVGATGNAAKTTYLTFSAAVQLPGVALGSGTYIFEVANPDTGADVVRVLSRDRRIAYFMGFTHAVPRPHALERDRMVSLGEAARGTAPRITAWWPQGESNGRQFIYTD